MKKVIDAGALRSRELAEYLSASPSNLAILTDYASMESFKGDGAMNIRNSLRILFGFPKQVIVLKSTRAITCLRPRKSGLHGRMIDKKQTDDFHMYCRALFSGASDPEHVAYDIRLKELRANEHFAKLIANTEEIKKGIVRLTESYTEADLKTLRSREPISVSFSERIVRDILVTTAFYFRDAAGFDKMPAAEDAIYSFPFRFALCSYVLTLKWIADGGHQNVAAKKLRNDFTDMTYAAYATFFDGLITNDRKLREIHLLASWILSSIFMSKK